MNGGKNTCFFVSSCCHQGVVQFQGGLPVDSWLRTIGCPAHGFVGCCLNKGLGEKFGHLLDTAVALEV
jgi:hypothetical protein